MEHLVRGLMGVGALASAVAVSSAHPWLALLLIVPALVALRGCPTCWTIGLVETVAARLQGRSSRGAACPRPR